MLNKAAISSFIYYLIFSSTIQTDMGTNVTDLTMSTQSKYVRQTSEVNRSWLVSIERRGFFL
jgi:hypothetical protein